MWERGGQSVEETVSAMKQIAGKISIIDDIAYQNQSAGTECSDWKPPVPVNTARLRGWLRRKA